MTDKERLGNLACILTDVQSKIDSGRHTGSDVQLRDRVLKEYLALEEQIQNEKPICPCCKARH